MSEDQLNFLVIPMGVIVGLSLAHVATSLAEYLRSRKSIRFYWVVIVWAILLFIYVVQNWYTHYSWRDPGSSFFVHLYLLFNPLLIYSAIVLFLPKTNQEIKESITLDQRRHYYQNHNLFFILCTAVLVNQIILEKFLEGGPIMEFADWPRTLGVLLMILLAASRNQRVHEVSSVVAFALLIIFIAT